MKKKLLTVLLSSLMLFVTVEASAVTVVPTITSSSVSVEISCGSEAAGKMVTIEVFEPESGFEALSTDGGETYTQTSFEVVDSAVSFLYQTRADAQGKVTFTYNPKGPKGKYYYRIGIAGSRAKTDGYFEFMTSDDAQAIVDGLKDSQTTVNDIKALFVKIDNPNVYNYYQILEVDKSELFSYFENLSPNDKDVVYGLMLSRMSEVDNATEFVDIFAESTYAVLIDSKIGNDILDFIDELSSYSLISSRKEYTNLRLDTNIFDSNVKTDFISKVEGMSLQTKSLNEITELLSEQLMLSSLSKCSNYGVLNSIIQDFDDEIEALGGEIVKYKQSATPLNIARSLIDKRPFDDMDDFISDLNDVIESFESGNNGSVSRPTYGGGGGGGTYIVSGTEKKEVTTEDLNANKLPTTDTSLFTDLDGYTWASDAIGYMKSQGIIDGVGNGLFAPGTNVKREEFAKMLVLTFDMATDDKLTGSFEDVVSNSWYVPYVQIASSKGIIKGTDNGNFGVGNNITREDMAVMCYRALRSEGVEFEFKRNSPNFSDSISDYAVEAVDTLYRAGILNGTGDNIFGAKSGATRAEAAKILYEILKNRSGIVE